MTTTHLSIITQCIEARVHAYTAALADRYGFDAKDAWTVWTGSPATSTPTAPPPTTGSNATLEPVNPAELLRSSKAALVAMCRMRGLKRSGTKAVLIGRLLGNAEGDTKGTTGQTTEGKKRTARKPKGPAPVPPVVKKVTSGIPVIKIAKNEHGNYEHAPSRIVFDAVTKRAIGTQGDDGEIVPLTDDDIDQCNAYKFKYDLPENLDHNTELDAVKVDELDQLLEEEEEEVVEEEEEVVEEEEEVVEEEEEVVEEEEEEEVVEEEEEVVEEEEEEEVVEEEEEEVEEEEIVLDDDDFEIYSDDE